MSESDASSEEDYDSHEMLDGGGQSSLFQFLRFTKDGDEQSSLPDLGEDRGDTIGQSANGVSGGLAAQLGKIQSSLSLMESRVKALEEPSTENSGSLWADRCRSPSPSRQAQNWDERNEASSSAKLSESSKSAVAFSFTKPLINEERKRLRKMFPTPDLPETKCPRLDSVFKSTAVKKEAKDMDGEFARLQTFIHDPAAPMLAMLKDIEQDGEELSTEQFKAALTTAIQLLGNASAQVSRLRRRKILKAINPEIQDLADEDIFSEAAPYLFGKDFEPKMKNRAESLKLLSASKPPQNKQFFRSSRPTAPQRGGGSTNRGGKSWWSKKGKQPLSTRK